MVKNLLAKQETHVRSLGWEDPLDLPIGKDPDAGKDWGQEKKGTTEDEIAGWHHRLNGHEFE